MGARTQVEAKGLILGSITRGLGIEVVRSAARLKLDRIAHMRGDAGAAQARRSEGRASWWEQRNYRARREGFARAQHFNEGGARRAHR